MSHQVPLQDTNVNVSPLDWEIQLQQQQMFFAQQIALGQLYNRTEDEISYSSERPGSLLSSEISVELQNRTLWQQFHAETTEMIITKSGRRMFPSIQVKVKGLNKQDYYYVLLEMAPASDRRHKYGNSGSDDENENKNVGGWNFAGPAEPQPPFDRRVFFHSDNPSTGEHWMFNSIDFSKLKITNNIVDHRNNVVLTSMHKYIPTIWIINCSNAANLIDLFSYPASSFAFKEAEFIAVTAYQNENITKLKINNNPFAKGFRETGQYRCKRRYHQMARSNRSDDEEGNSSSNSFESNRNACSLDDLAQESQNRSEVKIENSDDCDDIQPMMSIAGNQRASLKLINDNESVVPPSFHRPWLDSPSRRPTIESMEPMIPSTSLLPSVDHDLSWYYVRSALNVPIPQNLTKYCQYPMLQFRRF